MSRTARATCAPAGAQHGIRATRASGFMPLLPCGRTASAHPVGPRSQAGGVRRRRGLRWNPLPSEATAMAHAFDPSLAAQAGAVPEAEPQVRQVPLGAPLQWLRLGARDLHRSLAPSLAVGAVVAAVGWLLML